MEMTNEAKKAGSIFGQMVLEEREYECPKHGKYKGCPMLLKVKWQVKEIEPSCPICEKEADEKRAIEERRRQEEDRRIQAEKEEADRIKWLDGLNIGKRFWNESFETFNAYTNELKHHLDVCIEYAHNPQGRKLVMLGNNGTGKNHLAASILKITGGVIHTIFEIELIQSYSWEAREAVISKLCKCEMLVIDEIGRTKRSDWEENWMSYVINKRHENLMPLIFMSNKHLKDDCPSGGCPDCLQNWIGNDILSRIIEDGLIMKFTGEDYRERKRLQGGIKNAR